MHEYRSIDTDRFRFATPCRESSSVSSVMSRHCHYAPFERARVSRPNDDADTAPDPTRESAGLPRGAQPFPRFGLRPLQYNL